MKILVAAHNEGVRDAYLAMARFKKQEVIEPTTREYQDIILLLDQNPQRVIMDVNYGKPGSQDVTPILEVAKAMVNRGYNLESSLFGVTGNDELAEEIRKKHNLPAYPKTESGLTTKMFS